MFFSKFWDIYGESIETDDANREKEKSGIFIL